MLRGILRGVFVLGAVALVGASVGHAQDFYWNTASARSAGLGGVYVSSSTDVIDALATNPAGLAALRGRNLDLQADAVFARGSFSNSVNTGSPLGDSPAVLPYGAFGMPIGHSRWSFGVGVMPQLMSEGDWRYVDAPGTAGATYGLQDQKSAIYAVRAAAGAAYSFNSKLSVGVTVGAIYNANKLVAPYIFQQQPQLAGLKTLLDLHTTGVGWNGSVGVMAHPTRKLEMGVSWQSRTVIDSTGHADGDVYAQFAALGITAPSTFTYSAKVQNVMPQSISATTAWQVNPRWLLAFQADWVNWKNAFVTMPVWLTNGTNATINTVVGGTSLQDGVPLDWKDQYAFHGGVERSLTESTSVRLGYAHANSPVPSSTLTPLTAAIMQNEITGGFEYRHGRSRYEASYGFRPEATQHVGTSNLLAGEYDNSTVKVGTQTVMVGYSLKF